MSFLWGDWWEFLDEETGRFYYYNESTQQSLWVKPEMPIQTPTGDATADSGEEQRKKEEEEKRKNEELLKQQEVEKKELEAKEEAEKNKKELEIKEPEVKKLSEESPQKKPWERNIDDPIPEKVRSPSIVAQSKMLWEKKETTTTTTKPVSKLETTGAPKWKKPESTPSDEKTSPKWKKPEVEPTTEKPKWQKPETTLEVEKTDKIRSASVVGQNRALWEKQFQTNPIPQKTEAPVKPVNKLNINSELMSKLGAIGGGTALPGLSPATKPELKSPKQDPLIKSPKQTILTETTKEPVPPIELEPKVPEEPTKPVVQEQESLEVDSTSSVTQKKSPRSAQGLGIVLSKPKVISRKKDNSPRNKETEEEEEQSETISVDTFKPKQTEVVDVKPVVERKKEKKRTLGKLSQLRVGHSGIQTPLIFNETMDEEFSNDITMRLQSTTTTTKDEDPRSSQGSTSNTSQVEWDEEQIKKRNSTKQLKRLTSSQEEEMLQQLQSSPQSTSTNVKTLPKGFKYDPKLMSRRESFGSNPMNGSTMNSVPVLKNKESDTAQARCTIQNSGKNTLLTYAKDSFQKQKSGLFGKTKPEKIVQWQKGALKNSLHLLNENDEKNCLSLYEDIQKFIYSIRTDLPLLSKILESTLNSPAIRNEIIMYACKFINKNPDPDAQLKSVLFLTCLLVTVVPKEREFIEAIDDLLQSLSEEQDKTLKKCAYFTRVRLSRSLFVGTRKTIPKDKFLQTIFKGELPLPLYGVPLEEYFEWQNSRLPEFEGVYILDVLAEHLISTKGIHIEGIFRLPGDSEKIEDYKDNFGMGNFVLSECGLKDTHVVGSLYKLWLRELAEPLVPLEHYNNCLKAASDDNQEECVNLLYKFPPLAIQVIESVINFLACICNEEFFQKTKMNVENISVVFAPNIIRNPSITDPRMMMMNSSLESKFIKLLIIYAQSQLE